MDEPFAWLTIAVAAVVTYMWRALGVALAGRVAPDSKVLEWVTCVAYALLAGLVARMIDPPAPSAPADDDPAARRGGARALRRGVVEALGAPALLLFASYLGFGSLVHGAELSLFAGIASTIATFALPGQIVAVELYATGATLAGIALAVALTNVRLLPMTLALLPRFGKAPRWQLYALAHVIDRPDVPEPFGLLGPGPPANISSMSVAFSS